MLSHWKKMSDKPIQCIEKQRDYFGDQSPQQAISIWPLWAWSWNSYIQLCGHYKTTMCAHVCAHTHTHTHILVKTVNTRFRWASLFGTMNMLSCIIAMSLSMSPCNSNESGILCLVPHYPYECSFFWFNL